MAFENNSQEFKYAFLYVYVSIFFMRRFRPGQRREDLENAFVGLDLEDRNEKHSLQVFVQQLHTQAISILQECDPENCGPNELEGKIRHVYHCPADKDESLWQYEHIRQFTIELSHFAVYLGSVCNHTTCPQMKATDEWMYLCAAHKQPQECSAVDYIIHTLDGTAALLNSNKWFPVGSGVPESSLKYFHSITRRLYRILSHAFFHHKDAFDEFELQSHLCLRFVAFSNAYDLIPPKLLIIPREYSISDSARSRRSYRSSDSIVHLSDLGQLENYVLL
jgi:hypothetical protein